MGARAACDERYILLPMRHGHGTQTMFLPDDRREHGTMFLPDDGRAVLQKNANRHKTGRVSSSSAPECRVYILMIDGLYVYRHGVPATVLCGATTPARATGPAGKGSISSSSATGNLFTLTKGRSVPGGPREIIARLNIPSRIRRVSRRILHHKTGLFDLFSKKL